jgi:hypothetical protein
MGSNNNHKCPSPKSPNGAHYMIIEHKLMGDKYKLCGTCKYCGFTVVDYIAMQNKDMNLRKSLLSRDVNLNKFMKGKYRSEYYLQGRIRMQESGFATPFEI